MPGSPSRYALDFTSGCSAMVDNARTMLDAALAFAAAGVAAHSGAAGGFASSNAAHGSAAILRNHSQSASRDDLLVSGSRIPIAGGSIISEP
jgi:hypothetical protein